MSGIDSNTVLYLSCTGTEGSTTFTDLSFYSHAVTTVGNVFITTTQGPFSDSSAYFDGTGDYLHLADSAKWDLNTSFTIDFQARLASGRSNDTTFVDVGGNLIGVRVSLRDGINQETVIAGNALYALSWTPATTTWLHCAYVRSATNSMFFSNGTQIGTTTNVSLAVANGATGLDIGRAILQNGLFLKGWMGHIRVSDVARWTTAFTPPTTAYTTSTPAFVAGAMTLKGYWGDL